MSKMIEQKIYDNIIKNMPIVCVDVAIVNNNNEVLVVKRKDKPAQNQWWLPGGRVEKNEMMKDTAKRKAKEEVGLDCHVCSMIYTSETIFPDGPNDIPVHTINSCFYLVPKTFEVCIDSHHCEYKWINKIEEEYHKILKDYLRAVWR